MSFRCFRSMKNNSNFLSQFVNLRNKKRDRKKVQEEDAHATEDAKRTNDRHTLKYLIVTLITIHLCK